MVATEQCVHHWLIEPPQASTSKGRCVRCGRERVFDNTPLAQYDRDQFVAISPSRPMPFAEREVVLADEAM